MNKKMAALILLIVLVVSVGYWMTQRERVKELKIGAILALTSSYPSWSESIRDGLAVAVERHNSMTNDGPKIQLAIEDNKGKPEASISAFLKLATQDQASLIISTHTPLSQVLQPIALEQETPLVGTVVSAVGFGEANQWSFLDWPSQDDLSPPIAKYALNELNATKAATIVVNDDYGLSGAKQFTSTFESNGGKVLLSETFSNEDTDLRSRMSKIIDSNAEIVYVVGRETQLIAAVRQGRELGFEGHYVGVNAFDVAAIWEALGEESNGVIFSNIEILDTNDASGAGFHQAFRSKFGREPSWINMYGYSIGEYLCPIVSSADGDRKAIRDQLAKLNRETIRGNVKMSPVRSVEMPIAIFRRQKEKNVRVDVK
ncbi:MAG: ABC transporter substrate-binding protein [Pirellulaceae bacterium]|nr:ABC transporter substrate-binding protein [Pirellulaceae bacterium]